MDGEEMKPIGRLYLHRNQITQKSCFADPMFESDHSDESEVDRRQFSCFICFFFLSQLYHFKYRFIKSTNPLWTAECATTNYTDWSPCSASCGRGLSIKTRKYLNEARAESHNCSRPLMLKKICMAEFSCPWVRRK